jgi:hypothetical protein
MPVEMPMPLSSHEQQRRAGFSEKAVQQANVMRLVQSK